MCRSQRAIVGESEWLGNGRECDQIVTEPIDYVSSILRLENCREDAARKTLVLDPLEA